ncbi:2,3-bisphosphoglycerate-independent phosphoglycerate mutase [archaeon]|nr:2,3-bisphosphoglycerate-independent phosphoglycerate mutase [archaeon]
MKGILVILDGLGDLPNRQLGDKTPLEAAETPHLDFLATRGEMGYMYPIKPGYAPSSDESILNLFGNDIKNISRGEIEARGAGLNLRKGDLALRVDMGTISSLGEGKVVNRRAGRTLTTKEAKELAFAINKIEFSYKFEFVATNQHRAVLVIKGDFSEKILGNDLTYHKGSAREIEKFSECQATVKQEKAVHTAKVLNEFLILSYEVLRNHPVNIKRKKRGLLPANYLLVRGAGTEKPKLKKYSNWVSAHYMPLEIGFSSLSSMKNFSFKYPPLKGLDAYENLWKGLKKASKHSIKVIKRNLKKADYCYIHIKETDLPGHDNKPYEKKEMIEYLDKTLFKFLARTAPMKKIKVVVTGDHSTPCKLKGHSDDPVPVLFYNGEIPKGKKHFSEAEARKGKFGRVFGKDLIKKIGFLK